ncbi:hypothetical protein Q5P01_025730 [Channa striata]|uniref:Uncharacterized protein n=1 Tax=Channa striata TaxID=64152 RepID=A0AA88J2D6_CHASR|nr:hypothetical protein Q5P01_025730 [Channa striata]
MAVLCWRALLIMVLSAGTSSATVDQNQLTRTTWADVQHLCPGKIREGTADHAEYRTSQNIKALFKTENKEDLLLFYVLSSPCDKRCTSKKSRWSILDSINQIVNWNNYAVVFSNIFQPRDGPKIPESDLCESIRRLGSHQVKGRSIGLNNIFRCHGKPVQCTSCSSNNQVTPYCYSDESQSDSRPNLPSCPPASKNGPRDRDKQSSDIFTSAGLFANVDGKTAGGQRGSGPGLDSGSAGVKGRKRRSKRKKQNNNNKDEAVGSLSQSGQKNSNTNVDSKTAGGQSGSGPGLVVAAQESRAENGDPNAKTE